ncbi:MAG: DUF1837 domain-containing protein, partial [Verrucomicrobia bacterium]|nr:DUF1837 domain-containing protein [Verrucomicrobiota bacterium]
MDELQFDFRRALPWFVHSKDDPYVLVDVTSAHAKAWASELGSFVRRCYVSDAALETRAKATGRSKEELIAAVLPDPGSTMAGDFGEILVYLYHSSQELP